MVPLNSAQVWEWVCLTSFPRASVRRYEKHIAEEELDKLSEQQGKAAKKAAIDDSVVAAAAGAAAAAAAAGGES